MAIENQDCFLKGFLTGRKIKSPYDLTVSGTPVEQQEEVSVSDTTYDKETFLSGLAAGMISTGALLAGKQAGQQYVPFSEWAAYYGFKPIKSGYNYINRGGLGYIGDSVSPSDISFYASLTDPRTAGTSSHRNWYLSRLENVSMINLEYNGKTYNPVKGAGSTIEFGAGMNPIESVTAYFYIKAEASGFYYLVATEKAEYEFVKDGISSGKILYYSNLPCTYLVKGSVAQINVTVSLSTVSTNNGGFVSFFPREYEIECKMPDYVLDKTTRLQSIRGGYGIMGSNGRILRTGNAVLVNEEEKTVYNPETDQTTEFTDWRYDYGTRTYVLTTVSGETTVIFGDYFITIRQNGLTYRLAYAII